MDDINADWGGRAYEDVMKGTDYAEALPYVDKGRTTAAGASYGGYLVDWIAGHTDRFRALVSHDGVFDLASMYGATEELWFPGVGVRGTVLGEPRDVRELEPQPLRQELQDADPGRARGAGLPRAAGAGGWGCSRRCSGRECPRGSWSFRTRTTGCLKPANSVRWYQEVISWLDRWSRR
jgi:hypothetical protein